ncbi:AraC family transcriptional regulator [Streptomyces sp. ACA25]|uniref:AraC family transcriptional regulator n=1 Tax=Streptomyces sp. ACA25 TaxID=3022596 RepID=UPI002308317F|nr:AraC family transcriptional regulator [Streptomyces sp. ACA25]MDB1087678.1 AraC family transcriptional regulator [Streptomyces sp. ACA25]
MDTLTGLLEGPQARGAFLLRLLLRTPWSLRIEDRSPLALLTVVRGEAWVRPDGRAPVRLLPGDIAVMRGPEPYTVADSPDQPVRVVVGPDQRCSTAGGDDITESSALGVRTWGDGTAGAPGDTLMISGAYQAHREIGRGLLHSLPALLVQSVGTGDHPLVRLLAEETCRNEPGQELVLDRLLDLLLVSVLRSWLADPGSGAPARYRAHSDPVVGGALRLLHEDPAHGWTVAGLAAAVGVSRAGLARAFTELVGEPPMAYLTGRRLALAADLLREPDLTIAAVARQVGYGSAFALSAAFKRVRGVSPREYRENPGGAPLLPGAPPHTVVLPAARHPLGGAAPAAGC